MFKILLLLSAVTVAESVYVYSSFWAPLFDPRILNFRVDAPFDPESGRTLREEYAKRYGERGANLIADLGNGKGPGDAYNKQNADAVKFYYTYPGAAQGNK